MSHTRAVFIICALFCTVLAATYGAQGELRMCGITLAVAAGFATLVGFVIAEEAEDDEDLRGVWPAEIGGVE